MSSTPKNAQENEKLSGAERRRSKRISLVFQIEVSGREPGGAEFRDLTTTEDITEHGCRFVLQRELHDGDVVAIRLVQRSAGPSQESETQRFAIVWVEASMHGWSLGAKKLQEEQFWPVSFPAKP
jgi:hypothetical protein